MASIPVSMFYLFGRPKSTHRWRAALEGIAGAAPSMTNLSLKAAAANWCSDHRVHDDREGSMLGHAEFLAPPAADTWLSQIKGYFAAALCRPADPPPGVLRSAYRDSCNQSNLLAGDAFPAHQRLLHVGSLTTMLWRVGGAETPEHELIRQEFARDFGRPFPEGRGDWNEFGRRVAEFGTQLAAGGPDGVKQLSGFLMENLGDTQPPWWAT